MGSSGKSPLTCMSSCPPYPKRCCPVQVEGRMQAEGSPSAPGAGLRGRVGARLLRRVLSAVPLRAAVQRLRQSGTGTARLQEKQEVRHPLHVLLPARPGPGTGCNPGVCPDQNRTDHTPTPCTGRQPSRPGQGCGPSFPEASPRAVLTAAKAKDEPWPGLSRTADARRQRPGRELRIPRGTALGLQALSQGGPRCGTTGVSSGQATGSVGLVLMPGAPVPGHGDLLAEASTGVEPQDSRFSPVTSRKSSHLVP